MRENARIRGHFLDWDDWITGLLRSHSQYCIVANIIIFEIIHFEVLRDFLKVPYTSTLRYGFSVQGFALLV